MQIGDIYKKTSDFFDFYFVADNKNGQWRFIHVWYLHRRSNTIKIFKNLHVTTINSYTRRFYHKCTSKQEIHRTKLFSAGNEVLL